MLLRIESSDVIGRVMKSFDEHNGKCETVLRIRQTVNGPVEYRRRKNLIGSSLTPTFVGILTDYVNNYNELRKTLPPEFQNPLDPPALRTNAVKVSKYTRSSEPTARAHIRRLIEFGVIHKKFHGSKQSLEVWIKPEFLYDAETLKFLKNPVSAPLLPPERKNLSDKYTHREILKPETRNADLLIKHREDFHGERDKAGSPAGLRDERREVKVVGAAPRENSEISRPGSRNPAKSDTSWLDARIADYKSNGPVSPTGMNQKYAKMLLDFWFRAWDILYKGRDFTKEQHQQILIAITSGVYNDFKKRNSEKQWHEFQLIQFEKLEKAAKYIDKTRGKFIPGPYAEHKPGTGYFDAENANGFIGLNRWIHSDKLKKVDRKKKDLAKKIAENERQFAYLEEKRRKSDRYESELKVARSDFEKLRYSLKPRKEVEHLYQSLAPELALFNFWKPIFQGYGFEWLDKFCEQYQSQKMRDFKRPSYYTPKRQRSNFGKVGKATIVEWADWMDEGGFTTVYN